MRFLFLPLFLVSITAFAERPTCQKKSTAQTTRLVREYMKANNLILEGEEQDLPAIGIVTRWDRLKVLPTKGGCLVVMAICDFINNEKTCGESAYEVVGLVTNKTGQDRVVDFEDLVSVPQTANVKIGTKRGSNLSYYYVKLEGPSVVDAFKSILSNTPYGGFSGVAVLDKKAGYDPTSKRNWYIENATYSLRRGMTAEVLDVQAFQLDGLDSAGADAYWTGCEKPEGKKGKCSVAPWAQAYLRQIISINK